MTTFNIWLEAEEDAQSQQDKKETPVLIAEQEYRPADHSEEWEKGGD